MIKLVIGGAASGKSAYAEKLALQHSGRRIYLATMADDGSESARYRIRRHRKMREGKGFETVECPVRLDNIVGQLSRIKKAAGFACDGRGEDSVILLEDLPNLLANEMFSGSGEAYRPERILEPLFKLAASYAIVVVSANVFEDGGHYGPETERYIRNLAELHSRIAAHPRCEQATEVVCGIPVPVIRAGDNRPADRLQ